MKTIAPVRLLKLALYADAAGSVALAAIQLILPSQLADKLSLPAMLIIESGMFMAAYALLLVYLARARRVWAAAVQLVVVGNVVWAIACLALAATPVISPSAAGFAFLAFHAVAVLLFAGLERAGLRASVVAAPSRDLQFH